MPGNAMVQSVVRAMEIVQVVGASESGMGLAELARSMGVNNTTLHNLARTLASKGFLEKSGKPVRYRIGPALLEIVRHSRETGFLARAAIVIRRLAGEYPQVTWTLVQRNGAEFMVKLRMSPEQAGVLQKPEQRSMSTFSSASALAYQAFLAPDELESVYARYPFDEYGQQRWLTRRKFDVFLEEVRRRGYAMLTTKEGRMIIAAPVLIRERQIAGVLGAAVTGAAPGSSAMRRAVLKSLQAAGLELGRTAKRRSGKRGEG